MLKDPAIGLEEVGAQLVEKESGGAGELVEIVTINALNFLYDGGGIGEKNGEEVFAKQESEHVGL